VITSCNLQSYKTAGGHIMSDIRKTSELKMGYKRWSEAEKSTRKFLRIKM